MHIEDTVGLCSHSGNNRLYSHCDHLELWTVLDVENVPSVPFTAGRTYKYTSVKTKKRETHDAARGKVKASPITDEVHRLGAMNTWNTGTKCSAYWLCDLASDWHWRRLMAENGPLSPKRGSLVLRGWTLGHMRTCHNETSTQKYIKSQILPFSIGITH